MKNIFQIVIAVLGLSSCIVLSAQIPTVSWMTYNPFHYFFPYSEYENETQSQKVTDNFAEATPYASHPSSRSNNRAVLLALQRQLTELKTAIAQLSIKLNEKATKSELDATNTAVGEIDSNLQKLTTESATKLDLDAFQSKLEEKATKLELVATNTAMGEIDSNLQKLTKEFESTTTVVNIEHMPESCADLKTIGYKMNGFFQVKGTKQIENVYCDFTTNDIDLLQKWIGYADVKSAPVYFYAQRSSSFLANGNPITFDSAVVNEGNAMDLASGTFTTRRPGIYFFSFTGLAHFPASTDIVDLYVFLYLNGKIIGLGHVEDSNTLDQQDSPLTLQWTLNLKKNDKVWLQMNSYSSPKSYLFDNGGHFNHFTGFMLQEEIFESL